MQSLGFDKSLQEAAEYFIWKNIHSFKWNKKIQSVQLTHSHQKKKKKKKKGRSYFTGGIPLCLVD